MSGGTDLVSLGVAFETRGVEQSITLVDQFGKSLVTVKLAADDAMKSADKLNQIKSDGIDSQAAAVQRLSDKLTKLTETHGLSRAAVLRWEADQINAAKALDGQIALLEKLDQELRQTEIQQRRDVEMMKLREQAAKDLMAAKVAEAQAYFQSANEEIAADERAMASSIALAAQRNRALREQAEMEETSRTILNAQRNRSIRENAEAELRAKEDAAAKAVRIAEQTAIEEIKWANTSAKQKAAILNQAMQYLKNPNISWDTTEQTFGAAALRDLPKLKTLMDEVAKGTRAAHAEVKTLKEVWENFTIGARGRTEVLVLAHEALMGSYKRLVGSLMVFAEYTNLSELAMLASGRTLLMVGGLLATYVAALTLGAIEQNKFTEAVVMTGMFAGATGGQLYEMAHALKDSHATIGETKEAFLALAATGMFTRQEIAEFGPMIAKVAANTSISSEQMVKDLSKLAKDPLKAAVDLNEKYNFLTTTIYEQIKAAMKQNDALGAAAIAEEAYTKALGKRTDEIIAQQGIMIQGWHKVKDAASNAWDAMLAVGRKSELPDGMPANNVLLKQAEEEIANGSLHTKTPAFDKYYKELLRKDQEFHKQMKAQQDKADDESELAQAKKAGLAAEARRDADLKANRTPAEVRADLYKQAETDQKNINRGYLAEQMAAAGKEVAFLKDKNADIEKIAADHNIKLKLGADDLAKAYANIDAKHPDKRGPSASRLGLTMTPLQTFIANQEGRIDATKADTDELNSRIDTGQYGTKATNAARLEAEMKRGKFALGGPGQSEDEVNNLRILALNMALVLDKETRLKEQAEALAQADEGLNKSIEKSNGALQDNKAGLNEVSNAHLTAVVALLKRQGIEEDSAKGRSLIVKAMIADTLELQRVEEDRILKTAKNNQAEGEALMESARQMQLYGAAGKATALQIADMQIARAQQKTALSEEAIATARSAAATKDLGDAYVGIYKTMRAYLEQDEVRAEVAKQSFIGNEQQKVIALKLATEKRMKFMMDEATAAIMAKRVKGTATKDDEDAYKELVAFYDKSKALFDKEIKVKLKVAGLEDMSTLLGDMSKNLENFGDKFAGAAAGMDKFSKATKSLAEAEKARNEGQADSKEKEMRGYAEMAEGAAQFFDKQSRGYQIMMGVSKAFHIAEMGMMIARMVQGVITGAAQMFGQGGFAGFAGVAAMVAVMGALGYGIAGGFDSSSGDGRSSAEIQKTQNAGTVFGDPDAKSKSITKALENLEKNSDITLPYTEQMVSSLRNIDSAMSGLANIIIRTVGITTGSNMGIIEGRTKTSGDAILNMFGINDSSLTKDLPMVGSLISGIQSLFGGVKTEITDSGLQFKGSLGDLSQGKGISQYANVATTKSSWFGLSKDTSNETVSKAFEETDAVAQQFGRIFGNVGKIIKNAGVVLGADASTLTEQVNNFVIDVDKLSLKGLKGQELTDTINNMISAQSDTMAQKLIPGYEKFQRIGEGYFETVVRIASGTEKATFALEQFNIKAIAPMDIPDDLAQGDVASTVFKLSVAKKENGTGIGNIIKDSSLSDVNDLSKLYKQLNDIRVQLRVFGDTLQDVTVDMVKGAGSLEALQKGVDTYHDKFFTDEEKNAAKRKKLQEEFAAIGYDAERMPKTKEDFRKLVDSIDKTTPSGQRLLGVLMGLSGEFDDVATSADTIKQAKIAGAIQQVETSITTQKDAITKAYNDQSAAIQKSISDIQGKISEIQSRANGLRSASESLLPMSWEAAKSAIAKAIASAKAGNGTGDYTEALSTINKGNPNQYSSLADFAREQALTGNMISDLADITDTELEVAQKELKTQQDALDVLKTQYDANIKYYDDLLAKQKAQVEGINNVNKSVISVEDAIQDLQDIMDPIGKYHTLRNPAADGTGLGDSGSTTSVKDQFDNGGNYRSSGGAYYDGFSKVLIGKDGQGWKIGDVVKAGQEQLAAGNFEGIYQASKDIGLDNHAIALILGIPDKNVNDWIAENHPDGSHADGLDYVPRDGYIAQLHKGERVQTAAEAGEFRQYRTSNQNAGLEAKLDRMNSLMDRMTRCAEVTVNTTRKAAEASERTATVLEAAQNGQPLSMEAQ